MIDDNLIGEIVGVVLEEVFDIRVDLFKLRCIIILMCDLLYCILNFICFYGISDYEIYFKDIYDYLFKFMEMIEVSWELMVDIWDSYFLLNLYYMNNIMKILIVFLIIFMLLIFIVGVYGMNFMYMLEFGG